MDDKNFFDELREGLEEFESPMDVDTEWAEMKEKERLLHQKSKRKYSLFLLVLLLGLGCNGYLFFQSDLTNPFAKTSQSIDVPYPISENEQPNGEVSLSENKEVDAIESSHNQASNLSEKSKSEVSATNSAVELTNKQLAESNATINSNSTAGSSLKKTKTTNAKNLLEKTFVTANSNNEKEDILNEKTTTLSEIEKAALTNLNNQLVNETLMKTKAIQPLSALPFLPITSPYLTPTFDLSGKLPTENPAFKKWKLNIGTGIGYSMQQFSGSNASDSDFAALRENSETALATYAVEIGLTYAINSKFYIHPQLTYSQWYERLNYKFDREKSFLLESIVLESLYIPTTNQVIELRGDSLVVGEEIITAEVYNKYSAYVLQLNVGYHLFQKNRWKIAVESGLNYNFSSQSDGQVANISGEDLDAINAGIYKKSYGFGVSAAVTTSYALTARTSLYLTPVYSTYFSSITENDYVLKSKLSNVGVRLGVSYSW